MQWNEIFIESDILWYKSVLREQANTFFHGPKVITLGCTLESPKSFCLSVLHKLYPQYLYLIVLDWCPGNRNFYKCPQAFINSYLQSYLQILFANSYLQSGWRNANLHTADVKDMSFPGVQHQWEIDHSQIFPWLILFSVFYFILCSFMFPLWAYRY